MMFPVWDAHHGPDGLQSLPSLRNPVEHMHRRRTWNRAFSTASVKEYELTLRTRVLQLGDKLQRLGSETSSVDLAFTLGCFTWVILCDLQNGGGLSYFFFLKIRYHGRYDVRSFDRDGGHCF